jgi:hypothetical protein
MRTSIVPSDTGNTWHWIEVKLVMKLRHYLMSSAALAILPLNLAFAGTGLQALKSEYENARAKIIAEYAGKASELVERYLGSLQDLQKTLNASGDTNEVLAVGAEIERLSQQKSVSREVSETMFMILQNIENARERETAGPKNEHSNAPEGTTSAAMENHGSAVASAGTTGGTATLRNCATGATVTVSSTHYGENGESGPPALVDGDLFTRWSSDYSEPQAIMIQLKKPAVLSRLRLHWEQASATRYCVQVSRNGEDWTSVYLYMGMGGGEPASRIDDIDLKNVAAGWIRLDLQSCINKQWGFSLYEIEALGVDIRDAK